ncbi:alanine racemase [Vibrio tubiashii]|uniref:alanine racemase n=2 Tax=Vibrio tubiashii TaxID=29498 RepID=UPI0031F32E93
MFNWKSTRSVIMLFNSTQRPSYEALETPCLVVNKPILVRNLTSMRQNIESLGVKLRPHFKTLRSLEAAPHILPNKTAPITVSTLKEAEVLADEGYRNIIYAVGISVIKLARVHRLMSKGIRISVLLDSLTQAESLNEFCSRHQCSISALVEIDCDGHRAGVRPDDPLLLHIAQQLHTGDAHFQGVLTHAGEAYHCQNSHSLRRAASAEVKAALDAAQHLRSINIPCDIVSVGSTPTAHSYRDLAGITEVRAGVYGVFDLVMHRMGLCDIDDIAISVVTTVIGHNVERGWLIIDAGWMALSSDRGIASQTSECGFGLITDGAGTLFKDLRVSIVNQEHGIIETEGRDGIDFEAFPIGSRLHVLPNHACATTAMHTHYHVFDAQKATYEVWTRILGW